MAMLFGAGGQFLTAWRWWFHIFLHFFGLQQDRDKGLGLIIQHDRRWNGVDFKATLLLFFLGVEAQRTWSLQFRRWKRRHAAVVAIAEKLTCQIVISDKQSSNMQSVAMCNHMSFCLVSLEFVEIYRERILVEDLVLFIVIKHWTHAIYN